VLQPAVAVLRRAPELSARPFVGPQSMPTAGGVSVGVRVDSGVSVGVRVDNGDSGVVAQSVLKPASQTAPPPTSTVSAVPVPARRRPGRLTPPVVQFLGRLAEGTTTCKGNLTPCRAAPFLRSLLWRRRAVRERHWEPAYEEINRATACAVAARRTRHRAAYTWPTLHAARLAGVLGVPRITVIEFGVFTGQGLVALEAAAELAEELYGVGVDVVGFDSGLGLPPPVDSRDVPNVWSAGTFTADPHRVRLMLSRANLVVGRVEEMVPLFLGNATAPIGFIAVDVDQYHPTVASLATLLAPTDLLLPRVHCYFDDILGYTFGDLNGERLAIKEFNERDRRRVLSPLYGLRHFVPRREREAPWIDALYLAHILDHPAYDTYDGLEGSPSDPARGGR
jgi:hypothetical protein